MRKITLVRTVEGRSAIYWPGVLLFFTILLVFWVAGASLFDWAERFIFHHGGRGLVSNVEFGVFWSAFMVIWFARSAWLREKAAHDRKPVETPVRSDTH